MTESEWLDFMVFELDEAGEKTRLNVNKEDLGDYLKLESVFLIIYQEVKRIYLYRIKIYCHRICILFCSLKYNWLFMDQFKKSTFTRRF